MMALDFIKKVWHSRWIFRSLLSTIYFNFHYLPWKVAVHLPILLYKPKLLKCRGTITLHSARIQTGMVILGKNTVSIYSNAGIVWECEGDVVFEGQCYIGNASALSVASKGHVFFGHDFYASASLKLVSYYHICFSDNVHIGWDCVVMDTDLHKMVSCQGEGTKGYGKVSLGRGNWLGMKCCVLKNTCTSDFCTVSAGSVLNRDYSNIPEYSIIGPDTNVILKREGVYRDFHNDSIEYE